MGEQQTCLSAGNKAEPFQLATGRKRPTFSVVTATGSSIVTRAPTRIDFGGGWTDVPPYSDEMGGFVCNLAIARYATATLVRRAGRDSSPGTNPADRAIVEAATRRFGLTDVRVGVRSDFPIGVDRIRQGRRSLHCG